MPPLPSEAGIPGRSRFCSIAGGMEDTLLNTATNTPMKTARNVTFDIKQGKRDEFTRLFNSEVIPTLKKQAGFHSELALVHDGHASAISVWNDSKSADKYEKDIYPQLLRQLEPIMSGTATVKTYEVCASTL